MKSDPETMLTMLSAQIFIISQLILYRKHTVICHITGRHYIQALLHGLSLWAFLSLRQTKR